MPDLLWRSIVAALLLLLGSWLLVVGATHSVKAQDHRHPPEHAQAHYDFYWHLTRPDIPNSQPGSCCGKGDCAPTSARYVNGRWEALRSDGVWIVVPEERVVTNQEQLARRPDMQAVLCALPSFTYCFVPPQSGI